MRTKEWRLHKTAVKIKKRLEIMNRYGDKRGEDQPHRLHKWNTNCGCKMCHFYKWVGNAKEKYKHSDLKKIK